MKQMIKGKPLTSRGGQLWCRLSAMLITCGSDQVRLALIPHPRLAPSPALSCFSPSPTGFSWSAHLQYIMCPQTTVAGSASRKAELRPFPQLYGLLQGKQITSACPIRINPRNLLRARLCAWRFSYFVPMMGACLWIEPALRKVWWETEWDQVLRTLLTPLDSGKCLSFNTHFLVLLKRF